MWGLINFPGLRMTVGSILVVVLLPIGCPNHIAGRKMILNHVDAIGKLETQARLASTGTRPLQPRQMRYGSCFVGDQVVLFFEQSGSNHKPRGPERENSVRIKPLHGEMKYVPSCGGNEVCTRTLYVVATGQGCIRWVRSRFFAWLLRS